MALLSFLDREHTVAKPGFSRWMVPPAALCVHLCIGQAYALSVFNLPMTKLIGITQSAPGDWKLTELGWIFSIAMVFLGGSAAVFGRWVEDGGPRRAMFTAALCWAGGFFVSAIGVYTHTLWLIYIGYGVLGGCGLGIGYISPVSTLIKWFPDRPGMATGMAIMGFGGGAFIASPLSVWLLGKFTTATHIGVAETFIVMGCIYFFFMVVGSIIVRVPAPGWKPQGYVAPATAAKLITRNDVFVYDALKTPQFWLIWWVLCLNVTAGIGVLGQASAMSQEMFPGHITPVAAAGFVGLMSLFNMGGRFFWASTSDYIGRTQHVLRVHGARLRPLLHRAVHRLDRQRRRVRLLLPHHHQHVRRWLLDRARLSERHVRHALRRRDSRHVAHRVVGGRHLRSGARELHPRVQRHSRRAESAGLQHDHVHHGGPARDRLHLQLPRQSSRCTLPHEMRPTLAATSREPLRSAPGHKGETKMANANQEGTTKLQLAMAWGFVGIPLTLGVLQTLVNAMKLFQ